MYKIVYTKTAIKDIEKLKAAHLDKKAQLLLDILRENPYKTPPSCEKLIGDLEGLFSRRINIQHRLVYKVDDSTMTVTIISLWSHYE